MIVIPGGAIDLDGTGADNYVATFTGPTTIGGEANLTFDGSTLTVTGDAVVTDDLTLNSDSAVFNMGDGNDFTITHDGTTGATLAGNPITITSAGAATWSTSSGALTLTSAAAATWSTAAGALTIDGDDGIVLQTSGSGHITTAENIQSTSNTQDASIATAYANYGLVFRAAQTTHEYSNSIGWSEGTNVAAAISGVDDGAGGAQGLSFATGTNSALTERVKIHSSGVFEAKAGAVFNEGSSDVDFRIESNGNANMFVVDGGTDAVGIGAAPNINDLLTLGGTHTGYSNTFGLRIEPTLNAVADNNASVISVAGTIVEAGSGTHNLLFGTSFSAPTVTGGSAAVGNTATVYISGAPSATVTGANYALWVDGDVSRFDGSVWIGDQASGAPTTPLHVKDDANGVARFESSDGTSSIQIMDNASDTSYPPSISTTGNVTKIIGGTATSHNGGLAVNANGTLTTGNGTAQDYALIFDGNAQDYYIGLDDSDDFLKIGAGSTVGTTPFLRIGASGTYTYGMVIGGTSVASADSNYATGVAFMPNITSHSGDDNFVSLVSMGGTLAGQSLTTGGNTGIATTLHLSEPDISTSHTITASATLYIQNAASEATNDYALWVDSGTTRLDGYLYVDSYFQISSNNGGNANKIHLNNSGTSADSASTIEVYVNGQNDSDAGVLFATTYSTNVYWKVGIDQSNSKSFAITNNGDFGTNDALRITAATPPVTTYNTTHPTGTFDYVCESCGRHEAEQFECCGKVEWHDDVIDFRGMALRNPDAIDYMEKIGVIERTIDAKGKPEVFTVLGRDFEFAMSAAFQNRQRMDSQYDEMVEKINSLEKELQELRS